MKLTRILAKLPTLSSQTPTYSTLSNIFTKPKSSKIGKGETDTLYKRISPVGNPNVSVVPILDQWVEEGHEINHSSMHFIVKELRHYRRFKHALEIAEWMNKRYMQIAASDVAVRLDLIQKVRGVEEAENYFNNTSKKLRTLEVYGALLNCFAHAKCVDKAEDVMQKMRDLGFATYTMTYNVLLGLYCKTQNRKKLDALISEMEAKDIKFDSYTYSILLNTYGGESDVDGIEKTVSKMELDPELKLDWVTYAIAAKQYLKVGVVDKALKSLKKSERLLSFSRKRNEGYSFILKLYAAADEKGEVLRVWKECKLCKVTNRDYLSVMPSILKFDDIETAEKILKEWETSSLAKDRRVPNCLLKAYCRKGLMEKAEALLKRAETENWQKPDTVTWLHMAYGYTKSNQMPKAIEALQFALLEDNPRVTWKPNQEALAACLRYSKERGDTERCHEIVGSLKDKCRISKKVHKRALEYLSGECAIEDLFKGNDKDDNAEHVEMPELLEDKLV